MTNLKLNYAKVLNPWLSSYFWGFAIVLNLKWKKAADLLTWRALINLPHTLFKNVWTQERGVHIAVGWSHDKAQPATPMLPSSSASASVYRWLARRMGTNDCEVFQTNRDLGKIAGLGMDPSLGPLERDEYPTQRECALLFFLCILTIFQNYHKTFK